MPSRILRDYLDSAKFDGISAAAERLFVRLLVKVDDFGRFSGDARNVYGACCVRLDDARPKVVEAWLAELEKRRLIFRYQAADGQSYLAIVNFGQRLKRDKVGKILVKPKCPAPEGQDRHWLPTDGQFQPEEEEVPELPGTSGNFREVPGSAGKSPGGSGLIRISEAESNSGDGVGARGRTRPAATTAEALGREPEAKPVPKTPPPPPSSAPEPRPSGIGHPASEDDAPPPSAAARPAASLGSASAPPYRPRPAALPATVFQREAERLLKGAGLEMERIQSDPGNFDRRLTAEAEGILATHRAKFPDQIEQRRALLEARPDVWVKTLKPEVAALLAEWEARRTELKQISHGAVAA